MENHGDVIKWKHFRITGLLCGKVTGHRWIPAQKPVTRGFDVLFDLYLDRHLSKQWKRWWFETPSRWLWRHCNAEIICKWHESTNNCKYNQNFNYDSKLTWLEWLTCIKFHSGLFHLRDNLLYTFTVPAFSCWEEIKLTFTLTIHKHSCLLWINSRKC